MQVLWQIGRGWRINVLESVTATDGQCRFAAKLVVSHQPETIIAYADRGSAPFQIRRWQDAECHLAIPTGGRLYCLYLLPVNHFRVTIRTHTLRCGKAN